MRLSRNRVTGPRPAARSAVLHFDVRTAPLSCRASVNTNMQIFVKTGALEKCQLALIRPISSLLSFCKAFCLQEQ